MTPYMIIMGKSNIKIDPGAEIDTVVGVGGTVEDVVVSKDRIAECRVLRLIEEVAKSPISL